MSEQNLTAPETADIRRRVKPAVEEEILFASTTSSVAVVESPKRRKIESAADESGKHNRSSSLSRKAFLPEEKNDSSAVDVRLWRFGSGGAVHAPSSTDCSVEKSSSGFFKQIADPSDDDWLKSDTSSHDTDGSVVVSSPESEVCADLPEKEMESSKLPESTRSRSVNFQTITAAEIDEFFIAAEKIEAQRFRDKYNFDIVNDVPVKGRFEWSRVKH